MAVIINEFDVEVAAPAPADSSGPAASAPTDETTRGPTLDPMDLRDVMTQQGQRRLRVTAH